MPSTRLKMLIAAAAIAAAPALSAGTASAAPTPAGHSLRITATDYRFGLSRHTVAAGLLRLTLTNRGKTEHQAQLLQLKHGVTVRQFRTMAAERGDNAAVAALTRPAGGANTIEPGARQTTWQQLHAGQYVVVCLVDGPDGRPHLDRGMLASFRVNQSRGGHRAGRRRPTPPGHVAGTITAHDMTFTLPRHFTGRGLYRFSDTDSRDPHELAILKLAPGKHKADVIAWFQHPGPPPFTAAGGFSAVVPGDGGWLRLHLAPGDYVATCFVPDDRAPHAPHGAMGMDTEFTIR